MSNVILKQFSLHDEITNKVQAILNQLGLTQEQAVALFFEQIALQEKLPFVIKQPNAETLQIFKESEESNNWVECSDAQSLFKQLGI